jgi:hypothetical protein
MPMYERTAVVEADPDDLFHLVAELATLPECVERVVAAERVGLERVRVTVGAAGGAPVTVEVRVKLDRPNRLLRWGTDGDAVTGELEVTGLGGVAWVRARVRSGGDVVTEADVAGAIACLKQLAEAPPEPPPEPPHS